MAAAASAAGAANLYVTTTGSDANTCTSPATPCLTVEKAVEEARDVAGDATIHVAAGTYTGEVLFSDERDNRDVIVGASPTATVLVNPSGKPAITVTAPAHVTLEDIGIRHETADDEPAVGALSGFVTLRNADVTATGTGEEAAVSNSSPVGEGTLSLIGCHVVQGSGEGRGVVSRDSVLSIAGSTIETSGGGGDAVIGGLVPVTVSNSKLVTRGGSGNAFVDAAGPAALSGVTIEMEGGGTAAVAGEFAAIDATNTHIFERGGGDVGFETTAGQLKLEHDTAEIDADAVAVSSGGTSSTLTSDTFTINAPGSEAPAIIFEGGSNQTLRRVRVQGDWQGAAVLGFVSGRVQLLESTLDDPGTKDAAALLIAVEPEGLGLLVQRTRIIASPTANAAIAALAASSIAFDSSLVQGGLAAVRMEQIGPKKLTATFDGSTIDAGTPGVSDEPGIDSIASEIGAVGHTMNVNVEGSILLEPIAATLAGGASGLTVNCANSDAPSEVQTATATLGQINCRAGSHGNENLPALGSLFSSPFTDYALRKHTKAVNSVPSNTIALPAGAKPAPYDLDGRKRALYERVGRKCELVQDRGALQIPGQKADCKPRRRRRRR
ncbi:MAG TPA: hypothetical protein VMA83_06230 [Solirubrobacteraceae bacterium]|nr:hypothetical protein [Solirubrobacteraceae bacterium]